MRTVAILLILILPLSLSAQSIEAGTIDWLRDYDEALQKAMAQDKPIYIQFQEIPGCATCRNYGKEVLSNPQIKKAIESHFIPLLIHNNKRGEDRKVLNQYNEPSWNNPVSRIVDEKGRNILDRLSGQYDKLSVLKYINSGLLIYQGKVPEQLEKFEEKWSG